MNLTDKLKCVALFVPSHEVHDVIDTDMYILLETRNQVILPRLDLRP